MEDLGKYMITAHIKLDFSVTIRRSTMKIYS